MKRGITILLLTAIVACGQDRDLLAGFTAAKNGVSGNWLVASDGVRARSGQRAIARLADNIPDDYQLLVDFTRIAGDDVVGVIIPVGNVSPAIGISSWKGQSHGMSRVDGLPTKDAKNLTSSRPGTDQKRDEIPASRTRGGKWRPAANFGLAERQIHL
jgi:hypothetical protein